MLRKRYKKSQQALGLLRKGKKWEVKGIEMWEVHRYPKGWFSLVQKHKQHIQMQGSAGK